MQDRSAIRLEASGRQADEALAVLPGYYSGTRWSTRGEDGRYAFRYAALGDTAMTLRTSRMQGSLRGDIPTGDDYIVQWLVAGHATVDLGRDDIPMSPGSPLLFPTDRTFEFEFHDYDQKLVHLDRGVVSRLAAERGHVGRLRFSHRTAPSRAATALWFDTVGLVSRTAQRGEVNDLLWQELTRMTTAAFLELYPVQSTEDEPLRQPGSVHVRAAIEHMRRNAGAPLTPADIAAAIGISPRALQAGFQRALGTSPTAYLRGLRLELAHDELVAAAPERVTVAGVARRWGFAHLGRFSAAYRERYGRNPSDDLRA